MARVMEMACVMMDNYVVVIITQTSLPQALLTLASKNGEGEGDGLLS